MIADVVIAGAGIAGLVLAVALRRRGVRVAVFERASELVPVGAGLTLGPNAMTGLARLGLQRATIEAGVVIGRSAILDSRGRLLGREIELAGLYEEVGAPLVALHRARLHDVLLEAVGPGVVLTDMAVETYETRDDRVVVVCRNGHRVETHLLVGADGLHSAVRARLVGDGDPAYSGYTSWRGVTPARTVPPPARTSESWGRGERFGIVGIGYGEIYWFAVADAAAGGTDVDVPRELLTRFGEWHEPIRAIIETTPPGRIVRTDISDRAPIDRWHEARVVLIGDAAHPMTPNLGQGAGQAIEDAIVLDRCLAGGSSVEEALQKYERLRVPRANALVRASRRFGAMAQWRNPVAVRLRTALMRLTPQSVALAQARKLMRVEF